MTITHLASLNLPRLTPRCKGLVRTTLHSLLCAMTASLALAVDAAAIPRVPDSVASSAPVGVSSILTETWFQETQLKASDEGQLNFLGYSIAISGGTAIVGAPGTTIDGNIQRGAAYIFTRDGHAWTQEAKLIADDSHGSHAQFGYAVAISGDVAMVGSGFADVDGNFNQGIVYVFTRDNGNWTEHQKLTANDGVAEDGFGHSIALSDDIALIGAPANPNNLGPGAAYVFTRDAGVWTQSDKLMAEGDNVWYPDMFGLSVDLAGDAALIGAWFADELQGAAYVFTHSQEGWHQDAKLTASDGAPGHVLGNSVAISDGTALVAARDAGAAYVFAHENGEWTEQAKLISSDGADGNSIWSVALSGNTAVIASPVVDVWEDSNTNEGAAYVFVNDATGWSEQTKLVAEDAEPGDRFGASVTILDETIVVGATGPPPPIFLSLDDGESTTGNSNLSAVTRPGAAYTFFKPPADIAVVEGRARSVYCGAVVTPLGGTTVEISGQQNVYTTSTGRDGFLPDFYRTFLPETESPISITATAPDHLPLSISGITLAGAGVVTQNLDQLMAAPCATAHPTGLSADLFPNRTHSSTLTLGNIAGAIDLDWEITTAQPAAVHGTRSILEDAAVPDVGPLAARVDAHQAVDTSGSNSANESRSSSTPIAAGPLSAISGSVDCESEPGLVRHDDGTVEAGYSGNPAVVGEVMFVDHFVPIAHPATLDAVCLAFLTQGPTSLDFDIVLFADDGPNGRPGTELGRLPVSADGIPTTIGDPVWFSYDISPLAVTIVSGGVYIGVRYAPSNPGVFVAADESPSNPPAFSDGYWWTDVEEAWRSIGADFGDYRSLFVRAVVTSDPGGCLDPVDVPWLSLEPTSGATPTGSFSELSAQFDSTALDPGVYRANICLSSNDPFKPVMATPVTMTVLPPTGYTIIQGMVESLGRCRADPDAIAGAEIVIESRANGETYTVHTDAAGFYQKAWNTGVDGLQVKVTVSAQEHLTQIAEIGFVPNQTVTRDFDLTLEVPCAETEPTALTRELARDVATTIDLTLSNVRGGATLDWQIETAIPPTMRDAKIARQDGGWSDVDAKYYDGLLAGRNINADAVDLDMRRWSPAQSQTDVATPFNGVVDCEAEPGIVLHDDGTIEDVYFGTPSFELVDRFMPAGYPAYLRAVCLAWVSPGGVPGTQVFDVTVYDDDGLNGRPGTELGTVNGMIVEVPPGPEQTPNWVTVDLSALGITIESGDVYIGARWVPSFAGLGADESPDRPPGFAGGYSRFESNPWQLIAGEYRSLFVRAVLPAAGCDDPGSVSWLDVTPNSGSIPGGANTQSAITIDTAGLEDGQYRASLCISTNDPDKPLMVVPVQLTVLAAALDFEPSSLDFGNVEDGATSPPATVLLHSVGALDAAGLTFEIIGDDGFDADADECGTALPVGEQCEVGVTFTPLVPGAAEAVLEARSEDGAIATVELSGNGVHATEAFLPAGLDVDAEPIVSDGNGVFEPGELVLIAPLWHNGGLFGQFLQGIASDFVGPEGPAYSLLVAEADYGQVDGGATGSCLESDLCYMMDIGPPGIERPATHWEATFRETLSDETEHTWTLHVGDSFTDVPRESLFYSAVESLLHSGVTGGCTDGEYCPEGDNSRGQMAVFLLKAAEEDEGYLPPACVEEEEIFVDVPHDSPFCPWIEELAGRNVTSGCGDGRYCPGDTVTRGQMAVFLLKTLEGEDYAPPTCTGEFPDVECPSAFADWIEELAEREITGGCAAEPPAYCPSTPVSRGQMAAFVTRTFGLVLYGP